MAHFYTVCDVEMKEHHNDDDDAIEVARHEDNVVEMSFCDEADVSTDILMESICEPNDNHIDADMEGETEKSLFNMEIDDSADGLLDMSVQEYDDCFGNEPLSCGNVYTFW